MRVFIDLDEVLCDFLHGACRVHRVDYQRVVQRMRDTREWSCVPAIGAEKGLPPGEFTLGRFWREIEKRGERFWTQLSPLPWALRLIETVEQIAGKDNWCILSSPSRHTHCYTGKCKWIRGFFGEDFDRFIVTPYKHLLSRPGTILIDDRPSNIASFMNGVDGDPTFCGLGLLFPTSPTITNQNDRMDPVGYVRRALPELLDLGARYADS